MSRGFLGLWWVPALAACGSAHPDPPSPPVDVDVEECAASSDWLPHTPPVPLVEHPPHPYGDCPFFQAAWQNFLIATEADDASGRPALENYLLPEQLVTGSAPHGAPNTSERAWLGEVKQPGSGKILIDQNGHPLYYASHVNQAFAEFMQAHGLTTPSALQAADPNLAFDPGVVELQSAWQEVDPSDPTLATYVTAQAWVVTLTQDPVTQQIVEDRDHPRRITARLLTLHVAFTLPGHPEFIWSTFEHSDGAPDSSVLDGHRDLAPSRPDNPKGSPPHDPLTEDLVVSSGDRVLFKGGTPFSRGNDPYPEEELVLDAASQRFTNPPTSVYRVFPVSESNTLHPSDDVSALNHSMEAVFVSLGPSAATDKRSHYRLVGAQWLDKPQFLRVNSTLQNDQSSPLVTDPNGWPDVSQADTRSAVLNDSNSPDIALDDLGATGTYSPFSIQAAQDRLAGIATESFVQPAGVHSNCLSCHNTAAANSLGVPVTATDPTPIVLEPKLSNVSRIFASIVRAECGAPQNIQLVSGVYSVRCPP